MARYGHLADNYLTQYKSRLFAGVHGKILEIGPGAGANLRHLTGTKIQWIGVEPNPYMARHLAAEAERLGMTVELRPGAAEQLPLDSDSVDFVIATLVLCSVVDQPMALREIHRVLQPGGRLIFIEHVAAPAGTWLRRLQSIVRPIWCRLGDGCNPDRRTGEAIEAAGFTSVQVEHFNSPLPIVKPHIAGGGYLLDSGDPYRLWFRFRRSSGVKDTVQGNWLD